MGVGDSGVGDSDPEAGPSPGAHLRLGIPCVFVLGLFVAVHPLHTHRPIVQQRGPRRVWGFWMLSVLSILFHWCPQGR